MINEVEEVAWGMNLILPMDRQMPVENLPLGFYDNVTLQQMEPFFRGKISFVRELDTGAVPVFMGPAGPTRNSHLKIIRWTMSPMQQQAYMRASADSGTYRVNELQVSNFVFPDGSYGKEGYQRYVIENEDKSYSWNFNTQPPIAPYLNMNRIWELGSKFAGALQLMIDNPTKKHFFYCPQVHGSGIVVFSLLLQTILGMEQYTGRSSAFQATQVDVSGSKLKPFCPPPQQQDRNLMIPQKPRFSLYTSDTATAQVPAILELFNSYENRYASYVQVFLGSSVTREGLNFADVTMIHKTSGSWTQAEDYQAQSRAIRSTSHENLLNEIRQQMIQKGTDPSRATIQVQIYNHASVLPPEVARQITSGDEPIMRLLAPGPYDINDIAELRSVNVYLYAFAEKKDVRIARMRRMMEQCAVDCHIHYNRNVRPEDIDGSPICNYDKCQYQCVSAPPWPNLKDPSNPSLGLLQGPPPYTIDSPWLDTSTFDAFYSSEIIDATIADISKFFRTNTKTSLKNLRSSLNQYKRKYVDMAVERMVSGKIKVTDRFGRSSFLCEAQQTLYLSQEFPVTPGRSPLLPQRGAFLQQQGTTRAGVSQPSRASLLPTSEVIHEIPTNDDRYPLQMYSASLIANPNQEFPVWIEELLLQSLENRGELYNILSGNASDPDFVRRINNLPIGIQAELLERSIIQVKFGVEDPFINFAAAREILINYDGVWFEHAEPVVAIAESSYALVAKAKGRGRKPKPGSKPKIRKIADAEMLAVIQDMDRTLAQSPPNVETVYFHILYSLEYDRVSYNFMSKLGKAEGRIRLFKPSEVTGLTEGLSVRDRFEKIRKTWRNCTSYELPVYNTLAQIIVYRRKDAYRRGEGGIFGSRVRGAGGEFRVHDTAEEGEITDARYLSRGRICKNWDKVELIMAMSRAKIDAPAYNNPDSEQMISFILGRSPEYNEASLRYADYNQLLRLYLILFIMSNSMRANINLLESLTQDQLIYIYSWIASGSSTENICNYLESELTARGLVMLI